MLGGGDEREREDASANENVQGRGHEVKGDSRREKESAMEGERERERVQKIQNTRETGMQNREFNRCNARVKIGYSPEDAVAG